MKITETYVNAKTGETRVVERELTEQEIAEMETRQKQFEWNNELNELVAWFDNYFAKQLQQSQWQDDFTVSHDEYLDKDYANLDELKVQAKIFRDRIREIKEQLKISQSKSKNNLTS